MLSPTSTVATLTFTPRPTRSQFASPKVSSSPNFPPISHSISVGVITIIIIPILLALTVIFVIWCRRRRRRRRRRSTLATPFPSLNSQPAAVSGLASSELEPAYLLPPLQHSAGYLSDAEALSSTSQSPFDPRNPMNEPTSDSGATVVSASDDPAHDVAPADEGPEEPLLSTPVGRSPPQGAALPLEVGPVLPPQRPPRKAPGCGRRAFRSGSAPAADLAPRAPPPTHQPQLPQAPSPSPDVSARALETSLPRATPQPPTAGSAGEEGIPPDLLAVLGAISRLSPRERQVVAAVHNLLIPGPSAPSALVRRDTGSLPPPYME